MHYPTFTNLHFRPLPKTFIQKNEIDLRDPNIKKVLFVLVGITLPGLFFRNASNNHFYQKKRY